MIEFAKAKENYHLQMERQALCYKSTYANLQNQLVNQRLVILPKKYHLQYARFKLANFI